MIYNVRAKAREHRMSLTRGPRSRTWGAYLIGLIVAGYTLTVFRPVWLSYLEIENRHMLPWDSAVHFMDGVRLYQQICTLDLLSFILQLLNFGFWLPFHPILVAMIQFFIPYNKTR